MNWQKRLAGWLQAGIPASGRLREVETDACLPVLWRTMAAMPQPVLAVLPSLATAEEAVAILPDWAAAAGLDCPPLQLVPEVTTSGRFLPEQEAARARALHAASATADTWFLASAAGMLAPIPDPQQWTKLARHLTPEMPCAPAELARQLVAMDDDDEREATTPGEFARRGGILDVFSPAHDLPVRIEFCGDTIASLRLFSPDDQRSRRPVDSYTIIARSESGAGTLQPDSSFLDAFTARPAAVAIVHPSACREHLTRFADQAEVARWDRLLARETAAGHLRQLLDPVESANLAGPTAGCHALAGLLGKRLPQELDRSYGEWLRQLAAGQIRQWLDSDYTVAVLGRTEGACAHLSTWLREAELPPSRIAVAIAPVPHGIVLPDIRLALVTERDIFCPAGIQPRLPAVRKTESGRPTGKTRKMPPTPVEFVCHDGDHVVHLLHGIGLFRGLVEVEAETGGLQEMLQLEFADGVLLYVPAWQAHLVSRYVGAGKALPQLSRLGGKAWTKACAAAGRAMRDLAGSLLQLQALRARRRGFAFPSDDLEQRRFETAFPFPETPDQRQAGEEVKTDMAQSRPMDRLLCGDVGYGKTEVAMRAAFKAVAAGKQVAILAPTTILAQQHLYSFRQRFAEYPVIIDMLSRLRSPAEQRQLLAAAAEHRVDILIGTHRLFQGDVRFADLGLVIIDEEQRFGVEHKERLKRLRAEVDVLTLSATPIPRTLYMALTGLRDLSTIMTPPGNRLPVETVVCQAEDRLIRAAIAQELSRDGQIFYLHNRVQTIAARAAQLAALVPDARVGIAHGQLPEHELEQVMADFLAGRLDLLVCTTIIESGLDIPNANTLIIERADRFGLAELYQLRGRVGRWTRQAYAYLLLPPHGILTGDARERLTAIRRYTTLGAGFRLAMRDLELRGAGNLLGAEQSGHIAAIGFDLYCQLLRATVAELRGTPLPPPPEVELDLDFIHCGHVAPADRIPAAIPPDYLPAESARLDAYRRLARLGDPTGLTEFARDLADRCGPLPPPARHLLDLAKLRLLAARSGWRTIRVRDRQVFLHGRGATHCFRRNGVVPHLAAHAPERQLAELLRLVEDVRENQ